MWNNEVYLETPTQLDWLIFKTNITTKNQVRNLNLILSAHTDIIHWTIDLEDSDHVFRVIPTPSFKEVHVLDLLERHGFEVAPLLD